LYELRPRSGIRWPECCHSSLVDDPGGYEGKLPMILRRIAAILFLPVMLAFGSGVYLYLGTLKSKVVQSRPVLPIATKPKFVLPGTMFVVQEGRLFKLEAGSFTEIGPRGEWSQPTLKPGQTRLVALKRSALSSDLSPQRPT